MTHAPLPTVPFGVYAPPRWQSVLMAATQQLPETWLGRRLALWLRKPVLLSLGQRPIDVERLGVKLRLVPYDNVSEKRVLFTPQFFDSAELKVLRQRVRPGFNFIDVGANAGLYSLFVAGLSGNTAKIIAVEPQPVMLERLRTNIALNDFSTIAVAALALSDRSGSIRLHMHASNRGGASVVGDGEAIDVACQPLLEMMDAHGMQQPDAMKIDIEGAEEMVLNAFFSTALRERWPRLIFMERNTERWKEDMIAKLTALGYSELLPGRMNVIMTLGG